jgi:hypothetical protein
MCYAIASLQPHLAVIRRHIPNAGSVHTDLRGNLTDGAVNTTTVRTRNFHLNVQVSQEPRIMRETVTYLMRKLRLDNEDDARELRHACASLHKINPRAAWCLNPVPEPVFEINNTQVAEETAHPYVERSIHFLRHHLPTTREIRTEVLTRGGGNPKYGPGTWVRFLSDDETEVAALDTASFATHIREVIVPGEHEYRAANLLRLKVWAEQLGTTIMHMPQLLHSLSLCVVALRANRLVLGKAGA